MPSQRGSAASDRCSVWNRECITGTHIDDYLGDAWDPHDVVVFELRVHLLADFCTVLGLEAPTLSLYLRKCANTPVAGTRHQC